MSTQREYVTTKDTDMDLIFETISGKLMTIWINIIKKTPKTYIK